MTLSCDHRGAELIVAFKKLIENPRDDDGVTTLARAGEFPLVPA